MDVRLGKICSVPNVDKWKVYIDVWPDKDVAYGIQGVERDGVVFPRPH